MSIYYPESSLAFIFFFWIQSIWNIRFWTVAIVWHIWLNIFYCFFISLKKCNNCKVISILHQFYSIINISLQNIFLVYSVIASDLKGSRLWFHFHLCLYIYTFFGNICKVIEKLKLPINIFFYWIFAQNNFFFVTNNNK